MSVVSRRLIALAVLLSPLNSAFAAEVKLLLPQNRTAFQTNEWIDVSVVRQDTKELPAGDLVLTLTGADGSKVSTAFAVPAVASRERAEGRRAVEHLHVNGWLLRPGSYTLEATCDGATAKAEITVHSHVRKSSFRLINWGRATGKQQLVQGEDSLGFNTFYGGYGNDDEANFIRAGVDYIANCVMSGGHQMDLRMECDWADPLVTRGGTMRVVRRAMIDRTRPNVPGVHFYDEPGLTWHKHPKTGDFTPHEIPAQVQAYRAAFGRDPIAYDSVDPKNPKHVADWKHWATWKLGFMDAAWKEAQFGVSWVRPDFLSLTQSQYGWSAFTDGYYFNVTRSLPITSGHGGYHDFGPGYFNPSYFLEMARARDSWKQCWYLPTWYGNTTSDQFRLEQYLSFQTGIQGMMSPPDMEPATNATGRQGIVESNLLMQKLGPVFTTMPPAKPHVALLYSLSQCIHTQTKDRNQNYAHGIPHGQNLPLAYLAIKLTQWDLATVVEEDVLDGTLANEHKAVVLTSLDYLDPKVIAALEEFITGGGVVLMTRDCTVNVNGAVKLPVMPRMPDQDKIDQIMKDKKYDQLGPVTTTHKYIEGATALAKALKAEFEKAKIAPVFECDAPTIIATRHAAGDIEYLFAVNATNDAKNPADPKERLAMKAVEATIKMNDAGRAVYDALLGGQIAEFGAKGEQAAKIRLGAGQMRVFARTARPIGGIRVTTPIVRRDLVQESSPISVDISASLLDTNNRVLSGSAPLHVIVADPLGVNRYDLYRATKQGTLQLTLPLAANDPPGEWKVWVRDLLGNNQEIVAFDFKPPIRARSIAGATARAVYHGNDRDNIFRFARTHRQVTIVKGTSPFNDAAAERIKKALQPWGMECKEMPLAEAAKARTLTAEEALTWCGLQYAGKGQIKAGAGNAPTLAGFAVPGHVILLGNPGDNPIIEFLNKERFLPYKPDAATFPGPGRGFLAWQRDGVGRGQDSVTLIAFDEAGMGEAAGSFLEAVMGMEPLTKYGLAAKDAIVPAKTAVGKHPAAPIAWSLRLPDRVVALKATDGGVEALTHDNTLTAISADGKVSSRNVKSDADAAKLEADLTPKPQITINDTVKKQERADRMMKLTARTKTLTAIAYWGGTLRIVEENGTVRSEQRLTQDVTAMQWLAGKLIVGLADGQVVALEVKE